MEYPCLTNGLIAQYPISLKLNRIVDSHKFRDGGFLKNSSSWLTRYSWICQYAGLTDEELVRFEDFWHECSRGAAAFRFYDPLGNLLQETENLMAASWVKEGALDIVEVQGPGRWKKFLLTNNGTVPARLSQTVSIASHFALVFSLVASWDDKVSIGLQCSSVTGTSAKVQEVLQDTLCSIAIGRDTHDSFKMIGVEVPAQTQVILSSPQLEISFNANNYVPSLRGGIFPQARILPSAFSVQSQAPNAHAITVSIESER